MTRVALVLGAGGAPGSGFHAGAVAALARLGWDARRADLIVGTSAGSTAAALLRAGLSPADLLARACGEALSLEGAALADRLGPPPPPPPRWSDAGSPWDPSRWREAQRRFSDAAPSTEPVAKMLDSAFASWPERDLWICAVRVSDGTRVAFGKPGAPAASVGQAVAASCAIPGVYAPFECGGERYVDGGVRSMTSLDLVAESDVGVVVVSSPWSAGDEPRFGLDVPLRQMLRAQLVRELSLLSRDVRVVAIEPTAADQQTMGLDPLDPAKRAEVARAVLDSTTRRLEQGDLAPLRELLEI